MSSLREELLGGAVGVPEFRLALPPGWTAYDTTEQTERALIARARARLTEANRSALAPALAAGVEEALAEARRRGAFMMMLPGDDAPSWAYVPVSVLGALLTSTADAPVDRIAAQAIERRGARVLDRSRRFLRWEDRRTVQQGSDSVGVLTVVYLTPVPETARSKALQFTATFPHALDVEPLEDPAIVSWIALLDACFATFSWNA